MKKKLLLIVSTLAALSGLANAEGDTTDKAAERTTSVAIKGRIDVAGCTLDKTQSTQTVTLGHLEHNALAEANEVSKTHENLNLVFTNCQLKSEDNASGATKVEIELDGARNSVDNTLLANTVEKAAGGAEGVAIVINKMRTGTDGNPEKFSVGSKDEVTLANATKNTISYKVHYQRVGSAPVIPGNIEAVAIFRVAYK